MDTDKSQETFDQITQLMQYLNKEHLQMLNHSVVSLHKQKLKDEVSMKAKQFKRWDIVTAKKGQQEETGIIMSVSSKTVEMITTNDIRLSVSPLYVCHIEKPSKRLLALKEKILEFPIRAAELMTKEQKNLTRAKK